MVEYQIAVLNDFILFCYINLLVEERIINIKGINYIVDSNGKIYSTSNIGRAKYHKEITQRENDDGYFEVTVGDSRHRSRMRVHRIVALAFVPNPNGLPEIDHIDDNKKNNAAKNLQWIDGASNKSKIPYERRSESHKWSMNGRAKLTEKDVMNIRKLYYDGMRKSEISKLYGRGWSTIHNIIINNTWKGITE